MNHMETIDQLACMYARFEKNLDLFDYKYWYQFHIESFIFAIDRYGYERAASFLEGHHVDAVEKLALKYKAKEMVRKFVEQENAA